MSQTASLRLQEKYGGEFIARRGKQVLAHARTMEDLFKALERKKVSYGPAIRISHVHPRNIVCIY